MECLARIILILKLKYPFHYSAINESLKAIIKIKKLVQNIQKKFDQTSRGKKWTNMTNSV